MPSRLARLGAALGVAGLAALGAAAPVGAQIDLTEATCVTNGDYRDGPPAPTVPNGHIAWPAVAPVWEFDLYRPSNRTTLNSSGLELRNVFYRGRKVFDRAGVPVLNVEYDPGVGCSCFRDWQHEEAPIDVGEGARLPLPCLAETDGGSVRTACEANTDPANPTPGGDVGDFTGITVEDYGTELVLTSHSKASWYRYRMKWHFYEDGRIWPEFSFAAVTAVCTAADHRHHAYWRFDFDLDGTPRNDAVREHRGGAAQRFSAEASRLLQGPSDDSFWSVVDEASGIGYEIVPGEADRRLQADAYSKTDALVLRYKLAEIDDGRSVGTGCAFAFEPFVNGETLADEDVVFWYRSGALHAGGSPFECDVVGPMLRPVGFTASGTPLPGTVGVEIEPPRPNPTGDLAVVRFRVEADQPVTVALYDAVGRRVRTLFEGPAKTDAWERTVADVSDLPVGTYVVRVTGPTARGSAPLSVVR